MINVRIAQMTLQIIIIKLQQLNDQKQRNSKPNLRGNHISCKKTNASFKWHANTALLYKCWDVTTRLKNKMLQQLKYQKEIRNDQLEKWSLMQ